MNVGVVGAGIIWRRNHREQFERLRGSLAIRAFSARTEETRQSVRKEHPHAAVFADYRQMLADPEIEAVTVLTPIRLNAQVTLEALDAGKHVLVEKPFCTSSEEGRTIINKSRQTGQKVFILEQFAYEPKFHKAREIIQSGSLGKPVHATCVGHSPLGPEFDNGAGYGTNLWRMSGEVPLGTLFDGGIHYLSALNLLLGAPTKLYALGQRCRPEFGEYDHITLQMGYKDGTSSVYSHSGFLGPPKKFLDIALTGGRVEIGKDLTVSDRKGNKLEKYVPDQRANDVMWNAAVDYLLHDKGCEYDPETALNDIKVLEAVQQSLHESSLVSGLVC